MKNGGVVPGIHTQIKNQGSSLLTDLAGFWPFNETSGSTTVDVHGSNNGTIGTGVIFGNPGILGNCFGFTSGNAAQRVGLGNATDLSNSSDWSVCFWHKSNFKSSQNYIIGTDVDSGWCIRLTTLGETQINFKGSSGNEFVTGINAGYNDGEWHFYVFTFNSTTEKGNLYVDESNEITFSTTSVGSMANHDLDIGTISYKGGSYFSMFTSEGEIDHVGVWQKVLTTTEISDLYNSGNGLEYANF